MTPALLLEITASQVRMARAALRWSVEELARNSGVSEKTIRRIEAYGSVPNLTLATVKKLHGCFGEEGITLLPEDPAQGTGVRFRRNDTGFLRHT